MKNTMKKDTFSYKGWLISDNFLKRCFAVYGHVLVAGLIIWAGLMALIFVCLIFFVSIAAMISVF